MPLLGNAAVAMWWNIEPTMRSEFADWHSHEHFPERMSIPGFHRGSRWASTTNPGGFFVLYELAAYETLTSSGYLTRLNNPTPWSTKMMPHHRDMVRSQARIVMSYGGGSPDPSRRSDSRPSLAPRKCWRRRSGRVSARMRAIPG